MQKCKKDIKLLIDNKWKNHLGIIMVWFSIIYIFLDKYRNKNLPILLIFILEILHERLVWNDIKKKTE